MKISIISIGDKIIGTANNIVVGCLQYIIEICKGNANFP